MKTPLSETVRQHFRLPAAPSAAAFAEALGLHQDPGLMYLLTQRHPENLAVTHQPVKYHDHVMTSAYDLRLGDMPPEDQQALFALRNTLRAPVPADWLPQLQTLQARYPKVPALFSLETTYHRLQQDFAQWRSSAEATLERFPGYLYAACHLAGWFLYHNQPEAVGPVFNGAVEIQAFAGEDRVFHKNEVLSFYSLMAQHHFYSQRFIRAAFCYSLVYSIDPKAPFLDTLAELFAQLPEKVLLQLYLFLHPARRRPA